MSGLYATSRDEFIKAVGDLFDAGYSPQYMAELLLDTGKVRVLDPDDNELVERVRVAIATGHFHRLDSTRIALEVIEALRQP